MVTVGRVARWGGRLLAALGDDVRRFRATVGRRQSTEPTLRIYDLSFPHGRRRLHLRTAADGSAVLLVDATAEQFKLVARMKVFEKDCEVLSHPALVGKRLYIRNATTICCVGLQ